MNDVGYTVKFGSFQKIPPVTTIGQGRIPGRKVRKYRVIFFACKNVD